MSPQRGWGEATLAIEEMEVRVDHVHIFLSVSPALQPYAASFVIASRGEADEH